MQRQQWNHGWWVLAICGMLVMGCTTRVARTGQDAGSYRLTVYWLSNERHYAGAKQVSLYDGGLQIARVSKKFAHSLRFQGSGLLRDGTLVQYRSLCKRGGTGCLQVRVINQQIYPSGVGAAGVALQPLRSIASDRHFPFGTSLYIPDLGHILRQNGQEHNGCFVVHDRGGRIRGQRLDLFTGSRQVFRRFFRQSIPRYVRVYTHHPQCSSHLASR